MKKCLMLILSVSFSVGVMGQTPKLVDPDTNAVHSIDGIVKEMLRLMSGEEDKARNLDGLRKLFLPTASFTVLYHDNTFQVPAETVSLDEFLEYLTDAYYDEGFEEYETGKVVNEYNGIAQVFQSYYVKDGEGEEERGITSYQLIFFKNRWWIANIVWTGDSNGVQVPEEYIAPEKEKP